MKNQDDSITRSDRSAYGIKRSSDERIKRLIEAQVASAAEVLKQISQMNEKVD